MHAMQLNNRTATCSAEMLRFSTVHTALLTYPARHTETAKATQIERPSLTLDHRSAVRIGPAGRRGDRQAYSRLFADNVASTGFSKQHGRTSLIRCESGEVTER